jgi:hypothetical protein
MHERHATDGTLVKYDTHKCVDDITSTTTLGLLKLDVTFIGAGYDI